MTICLRCKTPGAPGEKFCASCGAELKSPAQRSRERAEREDIRAKVGSARKWLVAVSIITFVSGIAFYFLGSSQVEKQIREAEAQFAGVEPAERDRQLKASIGMTWNEAVASDRGEVKLLLFVNLGLAVIYLGLSFWAAKNAFAATALALTLFITVWVVSAVFDPKAIVQGILLKIIVILALAKAVSSAAKERKLYGARA